jgi:N-acetyl-gamma-glutamyl-phosphate reductase common form
MSVRIAIVGGRGYTGAELLKLIARHPGMELAFASSGSQAGQPLQSVCPEWPDADGLFVALDRAQLQSCRADAWVLAVPNAAAAPWAQSIRAAHPDAVILDLSADHRFDPGWVYGLPERYRDLLAGARDIANPGCYATGAQLGLLPLLGQLRGIPAIFGVSGYSGAGRAPNPRNDPARLADNLMPYNLAGHVHEAEISDQLALQVRFMPHVAAFFRGISLTIAAETNEPQSVDGLLRCYSRFYAGEALIRVSGEVPEVREVRGGPACHVGGFTVDDRDPRRVTLVAVLDNLSKGAASQAVQNLNLALGLPETEGLM